MKLLSYSPYLQWSILIIYSLMLNYHQEINDFLDKHLNLKNNMKKYTRYTSSSVAGRTTLTRASKYIILCIPIIIIIYLDVVHKSFSMYNLGITNYISNDTLNYFLRILGAYGIIQVLAQDFGLRTGKNQTEITKIPIIQFFIYFGTAYAITKNRSEAMIGALLYFHCKQLISNKKTLQVCFEDV